MTHPDREDLQIIRRHSNISSGIFDEALKTYVYNDTVSWKKFLRVLLLSLGTGFLVAGILFFFAYNWEALHKFVKIGIVEGLIVSMIAAAFIFRKKPLIWKLLLTGASALTGVLYAVYGQVYQTGADAYDLFLVWTLSITIFTVIAGFAPLWLIWILLLNITVVLFFRQAGFQFNELAPVLIFGINALAAAASLLLKKYRSVQVPAWFTIVLSLAAVTITTIQLSVDFFNRPDTWFWILLLLTLTSYAGAVHYGLKNRSIFFLALTGGSVIIMLCALIWRITENAAGFLFSFLVVIAGITLLVKLLMNFQKSWSHEKPN